jgi:hypothetical protein
MDAIKALKWVPVESGLFTGAAYRNDARQLYLRFRDGDVYRYFECPVSVYEAFLAADSKGRYFSQRIRGHFQHQRVHRNGSSGEWRDDLEQQLSHSVLLAQARVARQGDTGDSAGPLE